MSEVLLLCEAGLETEMVFRKTDVPTSGDPVAGCWVLLDVTTSVLGTDEGIHVAAKTVILPKSVAHLSPVQVDG